MLAVKLISKKKIVIYLAVLAVLSLAGWFAYKYFAGSYLAEQEKAGQSIVIAPNPNLVLPVQLEKAAIKKILEHPLFTKLEKHGNWPVEVDALGRTNPFQEF